MPRLEREFMTPCFWTSFLMDHSPEEMATTFAAKGWRHLELSSEHAEVLLARGDPWKVGESFRRFTADAGVSLPQGHMSLAADIAGSESEHWADELRRWLDLFLALGVRAAVLHAEGRGEPDAERRARTLRTLTEHVRGTDLVICLENLAFAGSGQTVADLRARIVAAEGGGNLGICLDTGHLHLVRGDQAAFIREAGPLLQALHIADNDGSGDQHLLPFGRGTVDWAAVTGALIALPYRGMFNFEVPGERRCPLAVRLAKLDYVRSILPVLLGTEHWRVFADQRGDRAPRLQQS